MQSIHQSRWYPRRGLPNIIQTTKKFCCSISRSKYEVPKEEGGSLTKSNCNTEHVSRFKNESTSRLVTHICVYLLFQSSRSDKYESEPVTLLLLYYSAVATIDEQEEKRQTVRPTHTLLSLSPLLRFFTFSHCLSSLFSCFWATLIGESNAGQTFSTV